MSAGTGAFTTWWADRYTRGLPREVGERRRDEIASDVFEQLHAASDGSGARRTSATWRTVRGIPADVSWRRQEMRAMRASAGAPRESRLRNIWAVATQRWFAPVAVLVLAVDLLFALAVATAEDSKMPGQAIGPVLLVLCASAIGTGLWLRWRATRVLVASSPRPAEARPAGRRRIAVSALAVLGVTLAFLTIGVSTGSSPVFFSGLVVVGVSALVLATRSLVRTVRHWNTADRASLADGLIVVGTFPALAMFWMIVPPILALIVIGGTLGTSAKVRPAS